MHIQQNILSDLILYIKGNANKEQQATVEAWLEESESNREEYKRIASVYYKLKYSNSWNTIDNQKAIRKVKINLRKKSNRILYTAISVAASLILVVSLIFLLDREAEPIKHKYAGIADYVKPGSTKATLTLSNGKKVFLSDRTRNVANEEGVAIVNDSVEGIKYKAKEKVVGAKLIYNTLNVPRGGEYITTLADGTKVWVNSDTEIRFPVAFTGITRDVYVKGEAFFKVKHNKSKPFIVHTGNVKTRVLGTSFNVMSYAEEKNTEITLVEGKVNVKAGKENKTITPGKQIRVLKSTLKMEEYEVNTSYYTSWKDGIFDFEEMTLEELTVKLSRWYDVDFFFGSDEARKKMFTGAIKKDNSIEFMLDFIKKTSNVRFKVKNKTIWIYDR